MFDPTKPLWLPPGSIRSILALWVVVTGTTYIMATGGDIKDIVLIAMGWYAIDKAYQRATPEKPKTR